jgi:D-alanine-D-alanine ligase
VGVTKVHGREELKTAFEEALKYDNQLIVEKMIHGRELACGVTAVYGDVKMLAITEIVAHNEFYDYDAKYVTDTSVAYIPARIPEEVAEELREMAVRVYKAIGCRGLSRVDFFVRYEDQKVVFNEINTIPGFTSISMYPKLFAASGIPGDALISELLRLALEAAE